LLNTPPTIFSPDLAPRDFYLFPKLKEYSRRHKFTMAGRPTAIVFIHQNQFHALEKRWNKCISVTGDYVERPQHMANICCA